MSGWIFASVVMLIELVLIVVGIVVLARGFIGRLGVGRLGAVGRGTSKWFAAPISAMEVLEQRYALGEIESEEFLKRKKDLQSK
jgi:uncharacterized membrane protein